MATTDQPKIARPRLSERRIKDLILALDIASQVPAISKAERRKVVRAMKCVHALRDWKSDRAAARAAG